MWCLSFVSTISKAYFCTNSYPLLVALFWHFHHAFCFERHWATIIICTCTTNLFTHRPKSVASVNKSLHRMNTPTNKRSKCQQLSHSRVKSISRASLFPWVLFWSHFHMPFECGRGYRKSRRNEPLGFSLYYCKWSGLPDREYGIRSRTWGVLFHLVVCFTL